MIVKDYKTTSVWAVMNEKIEWEYQLNLYAYLVEKVKKISVVGLTIIAVLKDWKEDDVGSKEKYPEAPVVGNPYSFMVFSRARGFHKSPHCGTF